MPAIAPPSHAAPSTHVTGQSTAPNTRRIASIAAALARFEPKTINATIAASSSFNVAARRPKRSIIPSPLDGRSVREISRPLVPRDTA